MWLGVLGPVRCQVGGAVVEVAGRLNRALLAALAVSGGRDTGVDELIDALWGDAPPAAAEKVLRNRVSVLRSLLTPAFIETTGSGYRLGSAVALDVRDFEDTSRSSTERLELWRGAPFDEIAEWPPARTAAVGLGELRAHLEELAVAERLDGGFDPSALVGVVEQLVEAQPFRERRWALLMRTLYLAGRQQEALHAFERARVLLRDELGLRPGAELLVVEQSILNNDPSLAVPRASSGTAAGPAALVGRSADAAAGAAALSRGRLVTLVGLGGVGKSSLARELIASWDGPRHLVNLSTTDRPDDVAVSVARELRIAAGADARAAVTAWAAGAPGCLVVLDNCEHVREAVADLATVVLARVDGPTLLVTSRVPLGHEGELVVPVKPLERGDAVALYRRRLDPRRHAVSADDPATIDRLCGLLGDVPLAIELAAARSSILSSADMVRDLTAVLRAPLAEDRTGRWRDTGTTGVVDVVAWAVRALSGNAQVVFRRCATFPAGFTMAAARMVTRGALDEAQLTDAFAELAEASLINVTFDPAGTRYQYLDLVRQRADGMLDDAGERALSEAHLVAWAVEETRAPTHGDLPRLVVELPNLAAAAQCACRREDVDSAFGITGATFVLIAVQRAELLDSMLAAVQLPGAPGHDRYRRACAELGFALFVFRGDVARARHFAELVLAADGDARSAGWATFTLGHIDGDLDLVRRALELAGRASDPLLQLWASALLVDNTEGGDDAWDLVHDNDRLASEIDEPWARVLATIVRGQAYLQVDPDAALLHLERAAEMADREHLTAYATVARAIAGRAAGAGDPRARLRLTRQALLEANRAGGSYLTLLAIARMSRTLSVSGRPDVAAIFAGAAHARFRAAGTAGRLYQVDPELHAEHRAMFDLGRTMEVTELVELVDECLAELDDGGAGAAAPATPSPSAGHHRSEVGS